MERQEWRKRMMERQGQEEGQLLGWCQGVTKQASGGVPEGAGVPGLGCGATQQPQGLLLAQSLQAVLVPLGDCDQGPQHWQEKTDLRGSW